MSATQGRIAGTGTGTNLTPTTVLNSGSISICCNAEGKIGIRSLNGAFNFGVLIAEADTPATGGVFGALTAVSSVFVVFAHQNIKSANQGCCINLLNYTTGETYQIMAFVDGTSAGTMQCMSVYRL